MEGRGGGKLVTKGPIVVRNLNLFVAPPLCEEGGGLLHIEHQLASLLLDKSMCVPYKMFPSTSLPYYCTYCTVQL